MTLDVVKPGLMLLVAMGFSVPQCAAAEFKSEKDCVVGAKVTDRQDKTGKIISVSSSMCRVLLDATGKETSYLFWMLHSPGVSAETDDKLVNGLYKCHTSSSGQLQYTFIDIRITGPDTYENAGKRGKYHVEPSRKIVFETGPLDKTHAKLLAGPNIGLNSTGGTFYATSCSLSK